MSSFKEELKKLNDLKEMGFVLIDEYERRKKDLEIQFQTSEEQEQQQILEKETEIAKLAKKAAMEAAIEEEQAMAIAERKAAEEAKEAAAKAAFYQRMEENERAREEAKQKEALMKAEMEKKPQYGTAEYEEQKNNPDKYYHPLPMIENQVDRRDYDSYELRHIPDDMFDPWYSYKCCGRKENTFGCTPKPSNNNDNNDNNNDDELSAFQPKIVENKPKITFFYSSKAFSQIVKGHCARMESVLLAQRLEFEKIDVAKDRPQLERMWSQSNNNKKLPQLHINDEFVSNWEQFEMLNEDGKVKQLLMGEIEMPHYNI